MPESECPWWKGDPPRARQLDVVYASTSQEPTQKTGLVCPLCKEAYGAIEDQQPKRIVFKCQVCGHRWRWDDPWPERRSHLTNSRTSEDTSYVRQRE